MDLALNNLQRLICHKTQTTNQPTYIWCSAEYYQFLLWLLLLTLFCAAIKRHSVSLLRFPFLCHVHIFSYLIFLVCCLKYLYSCFSSYFCHLDFKIIVVLSVIISNDIAVTGCSNQSFFALFYIKTWLFEFLHLDIIVISCSSISISK